MKSHQPSWKIIGLG